VKAARPTGCKHPDGVRVSLTDPNASIRQGRSPLLEPDSGLTKSSLTDPDGFVPDGPSQGQASGSAVEVSTLASRYARGDRSDECRAAWREYRRGREQAYRARKKEELGREGGRC
jgi:hypothetical protein